MSETSTPARDQVATGDGPADISARGLARVQQLRERIEALEQARYEPIAIVGIGCRLPGGVTSPGSFWELLEQGRDAITEVPPDRWDVADFYDPDPATEGRVPFRYGGFVDGVADFDPYFFGISPREASRMDPQQRLFLEVVWEALEDAGQVREHLRGSATGVFVGANSSDYLQLQLEHPADIDLYTVVGGTNCIIANRLSYLLDLRGPSLSIDSACSSSLVAVHLACQSLRAQEIDTAVVGGLNVILSPTTTMAHAKGLPLAPDGRCKTFDARADGYARGEGVSVVVLKRLTEALAAEDRIWAVIRGSSVNQDGLTNGLTAPNGMSQRAVIRLALERSRIRASDVSLVEAHGTGTSLGDPIEVEALDDVYGRATDEGERCALGSVKTNIGHLEAGAGLAGLVKVALSIHHRVLAPSLHLETLNPHIDLDGSRLFIPTVAQPWDVPDERRHGTVSSFGAGGTNAHVILGPAPAPAPATTPPPDVDRSGPGVITITAATRKSLVEMARAHRDLLSSPDVGRRPVRDIAHSCAVRRSQHEHRLTLVAASPQQAVDRLTGWLQGDAPVGVTTGRATSPMGPKVVAVFPGQGAQRIDMGHELMATCPSFRAAVTECDEAIRSWGGRSVLEEIQRPDAWADLDRIDVIQPALFAIAVGLVARCRSFGIELDAVVGHSMGEVAAAHVAGALSLDDAARIICCRSRLLRRISGRGTMLVVAVPLERAEGLVDGVRDKVSVAVSNSPTSTVLSGDPGTLADLAEGLRRQNVFCKPVKVDVASHSPQVDPLTEDLMTELAGISPEPSAIQILSTVSGELCDGSTFDADYWVRNLRAPVRFWDAVTSLIGQEYGVFVEMSPHPTLLSAVEQGFELGERQGLALPAMRRDEPESHGVFEIVGAMHAHGLGSLDAVLPRHAPRVPLPPYAWQHERFWFRASPASAGGATRPQDPGGPERTPVPPVAAAATDPTSATGTWSAGLDLGDPAAREGQVRELVVGAVADVLERDPDGIDPHDGFFQMGMDSMLAARVRALLDEALGLHLPAPVMFEHPSVAALARWLTDAVATDRPPEPDRRSGGPPDGEQQPLEPELSEEELLAILAEEVQMSTRTGRGVHR